ncbi:MAG: 4-hydroxythreonine-4-phosphate dehydrogenase PdxA [Leptonema sp. (in: Bacteria)]|nr:4-hydroxythreonine-4-phosphate dehydrogenase PdxA [Leptonema sp. (in: bacteria)]
MPNTTEIIYQSNESSEKKKHLNKAPSLVIITGGDPAGISAEVIRKSLVATPIPATQSIVYLYNAGIAVDGSDQELNLLKSQLGRRLVVASTQSIEQETDLVIKLAKNPNGRIYLLPIQLQPESKAKIESKASFGKPSELSGRLAFLALEKACTLIKQSGLEPNRFSLVTAPLSKEWVIRSGLYQNFSGHTGYLAEQFDSEVLMLMHGRSFSVVPLTEHVALAEVTSALQKRLSSKKFQSLLIDLCNRPVFQGKGVALCGVNPHCGEGGLIGDEESTILEPFLNKLVDQNLSITGPLSADTLFMAQQLKQYRLVLACYHDQGLIPFKALEGESGVNVTIGLPFLRTSPDHGTAFDLAGKESANAESMTQALLTAMSANRGEL